MESGCKKGDIIPVRMERCMEYIASEIGVMKAGCIFSPLIMDYPEDRVNYIMNLCESKFCIDLNYALEAKKNKPLDEIVDTGENDGIYAIFTSGSTGNPKGILHTNKLFDGFRIANKKTFDFTDQDIYLDTVTHYL